MPGPAPKANARRRNVRPDWVSLPANGFQGDIPDWPMARPTKPQLTLWDLLWRSPQAAAWSSLGWTRVVARYTRLVVETERPGPSSAALLSEVRQMEDRLGLSPMAMRRLQWEVAPELEAVVSDGGNVRELFG